MYRDEICIGSYDNNLCLNDFLFLSAYDLSEDPFKDVDFDGIIGLGFSELSMSPESNFLAGLVKTKKISNKIFAFFFRKKFLPLQYKKNIYKNTQRKYIYKKKFKKNLSELVIGGIDFKRIKGEIYFMEIISKKYWEVKLDNIYYGRTKLPFCAGVKCTAIIDTGTSTLGVSDNFFRVFQKLTNLDKNCSNLRSLRKLTFEIGGVFFELDYTDYVLKLKMNSVDDVEYMTPNDTVEEK
jgi:hypothetical protein